VALYAAKARPAGALQAAWKARRGARAAPVLAVAIYNDRAWLCGPTGETLPIHENKRRCNRSGTRMPHNLSQGRMAFVGEAPWHGLGKRVPATVTASEMIEAAGLAWNVKVEPAPGARVIDRKREMYDRYLVIRDRTVLGLVGRRYVPLQNSEAFSFFEPFIRNGWATFHTAGPLGNGERVWVLAKLAGQITVRPGDNIDKFLLLSNTHDGTGAVAIRFTPIRVVCRNTLNWAEKGGASVISVRHTKNIGDNLKKAQATELKRIIDKVFADAETLFGNMAARQLRAESVDEFLELIFPRTDKQKRADQEPESWTRVRAVLNDRTVTLSATRNTLWDLYNAIARAEDFRNARQDASGRLERVWFGSGHDLKVKALNFARDQLQQAA
jgi:phage/plasmid-like protein (TIGR03299 family)